jgi:hypothetical protein
MTINDADRVVILLALGSAIEREHTTVALLEPAFIDGCAAERREHVRLLKKYQEVKAQLLFPENPCGAPPSRLLNLRSNADVGDDDDDDDDDNNVNDDNDDDDNDDDDDDDDDNDDGE